MAEENNNDVVDQVSDDTNQSQAEQTTEVNVADVEARIAELQAQIAKQSEIVEKARKGEKYQKTKADSEVKRIQAQYDAVKARADALEEQIRTTAANASLREVLKDNGAKAVDTALKLIDRSALVYGDDGSVDAKSVEAAVKGLMESDSFLFETQSEQAQTSKSPSAIRATETDKISGFQAEVKAATSAKDLEAVLRKYGKA
jgi:hypothetical protein